MRFVFVYLFFSIQLYAQSNPEEIEADKYFKACGVEESVIIYNLRKKQWFTSDNESINQKSLPASTFKIPNTLIALESGAIKSIDDIIKWPGYTDTVRYGYRPDIYRDMTVREAFKLSAGWVYVELAKKIGKEKYKQYLKALQYGNGNLSQTDPDFWNFGEFAISPKEQVDFLVRMYTYDLPVSTKNIDLVKEIMSDSDSIRAKTGWTRDNGTNTGWWTGYIEKPEGTYFFATRLLQDRKNNRSDFGKCRIEITKSALRNLGIIE